MQSCKGHTNRAIRCGDKVQGYGHAVAPVLVAAKSPEAEIELIVRAAFPVFVESQSLRCSCVQHLVPKSRLVGARLTEGAAAVPVPVRFTSND